jgi:hypothetical protein
MRCLIICWKYCQCAGRQGRLFLSHICQHFVRFPRNKVSPWLFETAIVDYRLSFADQGKQTSVFSVSVFSKQTEVCHFRFPFAKNKRKLPFSVSSVFRVRNSVNMEIETSNRKRKTEAQAIFLNSLTICSSCKRKLSFVRLLTKKQTEVIRLQTNQTDLPN